MCKESRIRYTHTIIKYSAENLELEREVNGSVRFITDAVFKFVR
jgi:hypothetical protein